MKRKLFVLTPCVLTVTILLLTGCVAVPPLVNVQHDHHSDPKTEQRLKSMEERLERIEKKLDQTQ